MGDETVVKQMKVLNVCPRCQARFAGIKTLSAYESEASVEKAICELASSDSASRSTPVTDGGDSVPKRCRLSPCISCLGVLTEDWCEDVVSEIEKSVQVSGFQFSEYSLHLSVPVAIDLRQFLIHMHLKQDLCSAYEKDLNDIITVKEVLKYVIVSRLGKLIKADCRPESDFKITVTATYEDLVEECRALLESCPEAFPNRRRTKARESDIYNRTSVSKAIELISDNLREIYDLPPTLPDNICKCEEVACSRVPLYLGGRYNKYTRELSQTPWIVDGERRMESSVQELITDVVKQFIKSDRIVFSAAGREDVDVKMLGSGRPFVLEIINPRRVEWAPRELQEIENTINGGTELIAIRDLRVISKDDTQLLKDGEEQKRKTYTAMCISNRVLQPSDLQILHEAIDLTVRQKTPIRVLHRRTLSTRDKVIHNMSGRIIGTNQLELKIETQAGTYIKEFVHSDFGRTRPSLGTLLQSEFDILELDVENVNLEWPPNACM